MLRLAQRLEAGGVAPISAVWPLARCLVAEDVPQLRRWLIERAALAWRQGESISAVHVDADMMPWFDRALIALERHSATGDTAPARAVIEAVESRFPGRTGRRSIHGTPRRPVPDADLLLIEDVCRDVREARENALIRYRIEKLVRGFCIENDDLRWQLSARSVPRLRTLAQWFADRAIAREATQVRGFIDATLAAAEAFDAYKGTQHAKAIRWLVALPDDPARWHFRLHVRLEAASAHLRLRREGFRYPSWRRCDFEASQFGGRVSFDDWFADVHAAVDSARRDWCRWERIRRWRVRRTGVDLMVGY